MARLPLATAIFLTAIFQGSLGAGPALAFDTGHHFDLTAGVLRDAGFSPPAIRQAQTANWITDYLNTPVYPDRRLTRLFDLMHFDDLATDAQVRARWASHVRNTRGAVVAAATADDPEALLTVLGMSVHAVQDFYSHSNWVEAHPRAPGAPLRTETYFSAPPAPGMLFTSATPEHALFPSLAHGDYFGGMNKDSIVKPGWREAYVFADAATREWVRAVARWAEDARPGSWEAARHWRPGARVERELRHQAVTARRLSSWGSFGYAGALGISRQIVPTGADGHWKGNGSGSFFGTLLASLHGTGPRASAVAARTIALAPQLVAGMGPLEVAQAEGLEEDPAVMLASGHEETGAGPLWRAVRDAGSPGAQAVTVRTLAVKALVRGLDPVSRPDFYSKVTLAGQLFVEAPQVDRREATPAWTALRVLPRDAGPVAVRYALWDQDYPDPDDPVDLAGGRKGAVSFTFDPATGRVWGQPPNVEVVSRHPVKGAVLVIHGREAEVRLRLATTPIASSGGVIEVRKAKR